MIFEASPFCIILKLRERDSDSDTDIVSNIPNNARPVAVSISYDQAAIVSSKANHQQLATQDTSKGELGRMRALSSTIFLLPTAFLPRISLVSTRFRFVSPPPPQEVGVLTI